MIDKGGFVYMIKVSIIIPSFNASDYITDLVKSLLPLNNIEIIIIDDGSTDSTVTLIQKNFLNKVVLIPTNHIGPGNARNVGILQAKGKYIMFVDADDRLDIPMLSRIFNNIPNDTDITSYTKYPVNKLINNEVQKRQLCIDILENNYAKGFIPGPVSKIYNTKFLKENDLLFPESLKMGEDKLFNLYAVLKSNKISIISSSFYRYRNNPSSLTHLYKTGSISEEINLLREIKRFINDSNFNYSFQNIAVKYWINDVSNALESGASKKAVSEYRNYILSEFSVKELLYNKLSIKKKFILFTLIFKCYALLKVAKKVLTINFRKEVKQIEYRNI